MKTAVTALLFAAIAVSPLAAQARYGAALDGAQEVPAIVTGTGGWARVTLNPDNTLTYEVKTFGLAGTGANIHKGAVGASGAAVFALAGGPSTWSGTTAVLTGPQLTDLSDGLYYVNVTTLANPTGEVRGQLRASPRTFGARLDNVQETPPNVSAARGNAVITLNADNSLTYTVTTTGLVGGTAAHFHIGTFGVPGGIEVPLVGGPTTWTGTSLPISDGQIVELQTLGWYVNVHTTAKPGGEIRGQIVAAGTEIFNSAAPEWAPMLTLTTTGAPTDSGGGGTFNINIAGGKPGGTGLLLVALGPGASKISNVPLLINPATIIVSGVSLPLNGSGALSLPVLTPVLPFSVDIALQFIGLDNTAANGKYNSSSAVAMTLQHF